MGLTSVLARPQRAHHGCHGFTLVEVIIASLVVAVVAGGTMMAFIASANMTGPYSMSRPQDLPTLAEANALAQQTIESLRNDVEMVGATESPVLATKAASGLWYCAPLPAGGTASQLTGAARRYRVVLADCDGVGGAGDCYAVQSQVCWNQTCPCS